SRLSSAQQCQAVCAYLCLSRRYVMANSSSLPLSEQVVLVTGGARGLGACLTRAFLGQGARVVINYFTSAERAQALAATARERALAIQADVTDDSVVADMLRRAAEHFQTPVTTIVNNALPAFSFNGDARPKA